MSSRAVPDTAVRRRLAAAVLAPVRMLTGLGRSVLALALTSLVIAFVLNWQEFTQLGAAALGLLVVGMVWQVLPGTPVAELSLRPNRMVEGSGRATVHLAVTAGVAPMLYPKVSVPVGHRSVSVRLPYLGPYARHEESVPLPALPRGVYDVGPVRYEKTDPVGLVTRGFSTGNTVPLMVAPRVVDLSLFAGGLTNDLDGATSQQLSMNDLAFHALREYVPGDDLRHVHWRSSAKANQLLVRQYHETRRGHVTVLVDAATSSYPRRRDFELAVSVATSIALRAVRDEFDTYLRCGEHIGRGRTAVAMTDTACFFTSGADDYLAMAADAASAVTGTGLVVQVTGGARPLAELHAAAGRFDRGADWLVVRADHETEPILRDSHDLREISIPDLARLQQLFARGLR